MSPHPLSDSLVSVATRLADAAERTSVDVPLLVGLRPDANSQRILDVRCLDGSPEQLLLGWRAPATWKGCVLVGRRVGAAQAVALAVDGRRVPILVGPQLPAIVARPSVLADVIHRLLALPTPPSCGVATLASVVWLHRLVELAVDHPAPQSLLPADLASRAPVGVNDGASPSWTELAANLGDVPLRLGAATVRWFDAGSHARWVLAQLPDPGDLRADLVELLSPTAWSWLDTHLGRNGLATADLWTHAGCDPDPVLASFVWTSCDFGAL